MATILYTEIGSDWDEVTFEYNLKLLPEIMRAKITRYKNADDRQARITGKLLLAELLNEIAPGKYSLADIKYDQFNKPFINDEIHFSVSYADKLVICAAAIGSKVGIDAERLKPFDVSVTQEYFTPTEWDFLAQNKFVAKYFYFLWTRKEAILKAAGKGIFENFAAVDVLQNEIKYQHENYYLQEIFIRENYQISLATNKPDVFEIFRSLML